MKKLLVSWFALSLLTACGGGSDNPSPGASSASVNSVADSSTSAATSSQATSSAISISSPKSVASSSGTSTSNGASVSSSSSAPVGLTSRPSNKTCLAPEPVDGGVVTVSWPAAFPTLPAVQNLVGLFQLPDDNNHWYAMRQNGFVVRFTASSSASSVAQMLDIDDRVESGGEAGLLGVAVHPQFSTNRYVYFYYTGTAGGGGLETRIARYKVGTDGVFDRASEFILLRISRPYSNHVGGQLAFGSDGYLYIASGDGGSGGDPHQYGQNRNTLLGKILRIDVDKTGNGLNYAIPADNPLVGVASTRGEIWAYGLRNPWRFSFDPTTNELWSGDVGQSEWEEINLITRGGNYGWGDMEGDTCYSERSNCSTAGKIKPIHAINQDTGACSVIGGYVYRGPAYPQIHGRYFFSDYCVNTIQSLTRGSNNAVNVASHGSGPAQLASFARDNQGELYAIGQSAIAGKQILKLQVSGGVKQPGVMANKLSATGCAKAESPTQAATGLIAYSVNSELWSDGASKGRYLALPDGAKINVNADGDFNFPVGSVLVKHFKLDNKFVETRLFAHSELGWQGFSYEWLDNQTDALLLESGKDKTIGDVEWRFPSRDQCMTCHTSAAGFSLGVEASQLNSNFTYPTTAIVANQIATLEHIGLFSSALSANQKNLKLYAINDMQATLEQRARSYLHSNCSGCHQPNGTAVVPLNLHFTATTSTMQACNVAPTAGDLGIMNPALIAPGEPQRSVLLARMKVRDGNQMPPLGTHQVDAVAVQVINDWIASLQNCN